MFRLNVLDLQPMYDILQKNKGQKSAVDDQSDDILLNLEASTTEVENF